MTGAALQRRQDKMRRKFRALRRKRLTAQLFEANRTPEPEAAKPKRVYYCVWFHPDAAEIERIAQMEQLAYRIAKRRARV